MRPLFVSIAWTFTGLLIALWPLLITAALIGGIGALLAWVFA